MIYGSVIYARNQSPVPVFLSGKAMHSKYNPQNEALSFAKGIREQFLIAGGIGAGYHIGAYLDLNPGAKVIAVEADEESLEFCKRMPEVRNLALRNGVHVCTVDEVREVIKREYIPSLHGNLTLGFNRVWEEEAPAAAEELSRKVREVVKDISADFSVQTHFGKIWQRNILLNILSIEENRMPHLDTGKTAAIIAAGPTLDESIKPLMRDRESYVVISTDTAYRALREYGVRSDVVVSVDAQCVSGEHFFCASESNALAGHSPLFVLDTSASRSAVKSAAQTGAGIFFFTGPHPLSALACGGTAVPGLEAGGGTVTIAACDFARLAGFKRMELFGADFCYNGGKAYARGTYLDTRLGMGACRTSPAETSFAALMFRTEIYAPENPPEFSPSAKSPLTSPVLERYGSSLLKWCGDYGFSRSEQKRNLITRDAEEQVQEKTKQIRSLKDNVRNFLRRAESLAAEECRELPPAAELFPVLPYVAWLRKSVDGDAGIFKLLKLAYSHAVRYNQLYL